MDLSEIIIWIILGVIIVALEWPVGVLQLWAYDWHVDPWLEAREERRRKRIEKKETRKEPKKAQSQFPQETQHKLVDIEG